MHTFKRSEAARATHSKRTPACPGRSSRPGAAAGNRPAGVLGPAFRHDHRCIYLGLPEGQWRGCPRGHAATTAPGTGQPAAHSSLVSLFIVDLLCRGHSPLPDHQTGWSGDDAIKSGRPPGRVDHAHPPRRAYPGGTGRDLVFAQPGLVCLVRHPDPGYGISARYRCLDRLWRRLWRRLAGARADRPARGLAALVAGQSHSGSGRHNDLRAPTRTGSRFHARYGRTTESNTGGSLWDCELGLDAGPHRSGTAILVRA